MLSPTNLIAGDLAPSVPTVVSSARNRVIAAGMVVDLALITGELSSTLPPNSIATYEMPLMIGTALMLGGTLISKAKQSAPRPAPPLMLAKFGVAAMSGCIAATQFTNAAALVTVNAASAGIEIVPALMVAGPVIKPLITGAFAALACHLFMRSAYSGIGWKPPRKPPRNRRPPSSGPRGPLGV